LCVVALPGTDAAATATDRAVSRLVRKPAQWLSTFYGVVWLTEAVMLSRLPGLSCRICRKAAMPAVSGTTVRPARPRAEVGSETRHDWSRSEVRALFDLPFPELLFRAASVHRENFDPGEV